MRPCSTSPFRVRGRQFGGVQPLFCVPLVAQDSRHLIEQADAAQSLAPDLLEWRADSFRDASPAALVDAAQQLRTALPADQPIIFTLRCKSEGGERDLSPSERRTALEALIRSRHMDLVDVELSNGAEFLDAVTSAAHECQVRVILSFHDFESTPTNGALTGIIDDMNARGADLAKIAVMPRERSDVLRLLHFTLETRERLPHLILSTMSMGALGKISRVAGFLFGSDLAYAAGLKASAPGQIPLADARLVAKALTDED